MTNQEVVAVGTEPLAQCFCQVDGAVLSAGAANGNREVASIFRGKTRCPAGHEVDHVAKKLLDLGNRVEK